MAAACKHRIILEDKSKANLKDWITSESITDDTQNESNT